MTLKELLGTLDAEQVTLITDAITAERNLGVEKYKESETKLKEFETAMESLGYDSEKGDIETFTRSKQESENPLTVEALQSELQTLKGSLADKELETARNTMFNKISDGVGKELIGSRLIIKEALDNERFVIEGDKVFFKGEDGAPVDISKGYEALLAENADAVVNTVQGGAETTSAEAQSTSDESFDMMMDIMHG